MANIDPDMGFRVHIWLQPFSPAIVCAFVWFIQGVSALVDSPRTYEEALAVLTKYHDEGDPNNPIVIL